MKKLISKLIVLSSFIFITACGGQSADSLVLDFFKSLSDGDGEKAYSLFYVSSQDQKSVGAMYAKSLFQGLAEESKKGGGLKKYEVLEVSDYTDDEKMNEKFKNIQKVIVLIEDHKGNEHKENFLVGDFDGKKYIIEIRSFIK